MKSKRASVPPYNPELRDLIVGKKRALAPLDNSAIKQGFQGWHERGYLPHRDSPGLIQFVTFRLGDSFPAALRAEWEPLFKLQNIRKRRAELEAYLDCGHGNCHLRNPEVAGIVETAIRFFHGETYDLRAWVIMPNHLHLLFKTSTVPLAQIIQSLKSFTAKRANKILRRAGKFWQDDYWDTFMRDADHERRSLNYIERNPVKARLSRAPKDWPWTSARFRDEYDILRLPKP